MSQDFVPHAVLDDVSLPSAWNMTAGATVQVFTGWLLYDSLTEPNAFTNRVFLLGESIGVTIGDGWGLSFGLNTGVHIATIFTFGGNTGEVATGTSVSTWFHVLAIFDQANTLIELYIDNVQKHSDGAYADTSAITSAELRIGATNDTPLFGWDGKMADFAFLNTVPTAGQRAALAAAFSPELVMPASIIDSYRFIRSTDGRKGSTLTKTGTINIAAHPGTRYPSTPYLVTAPGVAAFVPYPNPRYALTAGMQPMGGGV